MLASTPKFSDLVKDALTSDTKLQEKFTLICNYLTSQKSESKGIGEIVATIKHALVKKTYCICEKHRALRLLAHAMKSPSTKLVETLLKDLLGKMRELANSPFIEYKQRCTVCTPDKQREHSTAFNALLLTTIREWAKRFSFDTAGRPTEFRKVYLKLKIRGVNFESRQFLSAPLSSFLEHTSRLLACLSQALAAQDSNEEYKVHLKNNLQAAQTRIIAELKSAYAPHVMNQLTQINNDIRAMLGQPSPQKPAQPDLTEEFNTLQSNLVKMIQDQSRLNATNEELRMKLVALSELQTEQAELNEHRPTTYKFSTHRSHLLEFRYPRNPFEETQPTVTQRPANDALTISNNEAYWKCCAVQNGLLYENEALQINTRVTMENNRLFVYLLIGNKTSEVIKSVVLQCLETAGLVAEVAETPAVPNILQRSEYQIKISVQFTSLTVECPVVRLDYETHRPMSLLLKLPVHLTRVFYGTNKSSHKIYNRWKQLADCSLSCSLSLCKISKLELLVPHLSQGGSFTIFSEKDISELTRFEYLGAGRSDALLLFKLKIRTTADVELEMRSSNTDQASVVMEILRMQLSAS